MKLKESALGHLVRHCSHVHRTVRIPMKLMGLAMGHLLNLCGYDLLLYSREHLENRVCYNQANVPCPEAMMVYDL